MKLRDQGGGTFDLLGRHLKGKEQYGYDFASDRDPLKELSEELYDSLNYLDAASAERTYLRQMIRLLYIVIRRNGGARLPDGLINIATSYDDDSIVEQAEWLLALWDEDAGG